MSVFNFVATTASRFIGALDRRIITLATVDVEAMLSDSGAAGSGGALEAVNQQVASYGGGAYTIARNAAVYVVAVALIAGAAALALNAGNPSKREESKTVFAHRFIAAVMVFGGVAMLIFAQKIGEMLFK